VRPILNYVRSLAFSPDSESRIWDVETGIAVLSPLAGLTDHIRCVAFSPDGKYVRVISCSDDKTIRIWNIEIVVGQALQSPLESHTDYAVSVAFSLSAVFGSHDKTIRIWDVADSLQERQS
jgi:WD40 repeat protein